MKKTQTATDYMKQIFAHAVALDQSGGLRNTVFAHGREVFILNYDHTVLLRFRLKGGTAFEHPVSFRANDYDSDTFYEQDGKIVFLDKKGEYTRRKTCSVPDQTFEQIKTTFQNYIERELETAPITLSKDILTKLDRDLSHIEITGKKGERLKLTQRNIYSGSVIEVEPKDHMLSEKMPFDIEPIGLRTNDFAALFAFRDSVTFNFPKAGEPDSWVKIKARELLGLVACCIYDELINVKEAKDNGR